MRLKERNAWTSKQLRLSLNSRRITEKILRHTTIINKGHRESLREVIKMKVLKRKLLLFFQSLTKRPT